MKKFEIGLFALCVLVGNYYGSMFGMAVAVCVFMTIDGLIEEIGKNFRSKIKTKNLNKEEKVNA